MLEKEQMPTSKHPWVTPVLHDLSVEQTASGVPLSSEGPMMIGPFTTQQQSNFVS